MLIASVLFEEAGCNVCWQLQSVLADKLAKLVVNEINVTVESRQDFLTDIICAEVRIKVPSMRFEKSFNLSDWHRLIIVTVELLEHLLHRLLVNLVAAKACDSLLELHHVECTLGDCLAGTVDKPLVDTGVSLLKVSGYLH